MFTADGNSVFIGEGAGILFTRDGTLIPEEIEPGFEGSMTRGYWKVAYISRDESKIVLAPRDMESGKGGITFFKMVKTPEPIPTPTPIPETNPPISQTSPFAPPPEPATPSISFYIITAAVAVIVLGGAFLKMRK